MSALQLWVRRFYPGGVFSGFRKMRLPPSAKGENAEAALICEICPTMLQERFIFKKA
jgi:hypothetical protein